MADGRKRSGPRRTLRRVPAFQKNELYAWHLIYEYPGTAVYVFCISRHHLFCGQLLSYDEPHRVSRAELREDLHRRKAFRGTARMSEGKLVKFAHLLRPALQKNER